MLIYDNVLTDYLAWFHVKHALAIVL